MSATQRSRVAILAGGRGTRLAARTGGLPKPLAEVAGRSVLEHQIRLAVQHGFPDILLLVCHGHEAIRSRFGAGEALGARLAYRQEAQPRGTAGALVDALPQLDDQVLVLYGDTYADVDLAAVWRRHREAEADATLLLHPNDHPFDSDLVEIDSEGWVLRIHGYPHPDRLPCRNLVNAGLCVIETAAIGSLVPETGQHDIAKHLFPRMLGAGRRLLGHVTPEYIKDMGTPERLDRVNADVAAGLPEALSARRRRRAVLLDRDGTINVEKGLIRTPEEIELLPGAAEAIRRLNRAGWVVACVTNQPVIARGEVDEAGLDRIHAALDGALARSGAWLDRLLFCPHHPDRGFPGEVASLKVRCECRKPAPGLLLRAIDELALDRANSWMVGDSWVDVEAGRSAGLRTILLGSGKADASALARCRPDYVLPDLAAAVTWILDIYPWLCTRLEAAVTSAAAGSTVAISGRPAAAGPAIHRLLEELLAACDREAGLPPGGLRLQGGLDPPSPEVFELHLGPRPEPYGANAARPCPGRSHERIEIDLSGFLPVSRGGVS